MSFKEESTFTVTFNYYNILITMNNVIQKKSFAKVNALPSIFRKIKNPIKLEFLFCDRIYNYKNILNE